MSSERQRQFNIWCTLQGAELMLEILRRERNDMLLRHSYRERADADMLAHVIDQLDASITLVVKGYR